MATLNVSEANRTSLDVTLPAEPGSIARVSVLVSRLLGERGSARAGDVRVAVIEACGNVVRHAYHETDRERSMRVAASVSRSAVVVQVDDRGRGLASRHSVPGEGIGLQLIRRLADEARIESRAGGGTSVVMTFRHEP